MKLEIYGATQPEEKVIRLRLEPLFTNSADVALRAVDEDGNSLGSGTLLVIRGSGEIYRCPSIHRGIGLPLDGHGRLRLEDETT